MAGVRLDVTRLQTLLGAAVVLVLSTVLAYAQVAAPPPAPNAATAAPVTLTEPEQLVVAVKVVGNHTVATSKILGLLTTRPERPFNQAAFEKDVRTLAAKGWFIDVKPQKEIVPGGVVVTFKVVERPTLQYVKYLGIKKVKEKHLAKQTELKKGGSLDPYAVEEGRRKIEEYYKENGYNHVQVSILEGTRLGDRGAIYLINEGQSQRVWNVSFVGNTIASGARLKTQIQSKPPILYLFKGYVERKKIDEDVERLTAYYRSLGFFRARIGRELEYDEDNEWLTLTFVIDEGPRYVVRNVAFIGNTKYETEQLAELLDLKGGKHFDQASMNKDIGTVRDIYGSQGYIFTDVQADPRFLEEPGQLDLVYNISEGDRYRVARINVHVGGDNPHTRHNAVLNRISLRPGDIVDIRQLRASERRLKASGLFLADPTKGNAPKITFSPPGTEKDEELARKKGPRGNFRGQSPDTAPGDKFIGISVDGAIDPNWTGPEYPTQSEQRAAEGSQAPLPPPATRVAEPQSYTVRGQSPDGSWRRDSLVQPAQAFGGVPLQPTNPDLRPRVNFQSPSAPSMTGANEAPVYQSNGQQWPPATYGQPPATAPYQTYPPQQYPPPQYAAPPNGATRTTGVPGNYGPPGVPAGPNPYGGALPPNGFSAPPQQPPPLVGLDGQPLLNDQSMPEKYIPLDAYVEETQTGRFMLGVGVNSEAGLIGSIVIDEQNFDWRRWPTGIEDFRNGTAFRGAGQRFRIEAAPGTQVQRYMFNFAEPYLFDTPVQFGLSGFYYQRFFRDWTEARLGGKVDLGYQFSPDLAGTISLGAQQVDISNPRVPTVTELDEVLGETALYTAGARLAHDTRDNTFLATEGHLISLSVEQNFGDFQFPRANTDLRQFFMLSQRPDGSGRHVLSLIGRLGVSGSDTPIYEHYFAGGFSTIRGFQFRGASPVVANTIVGGEFQALGTVEYMFPITADDMLRMVVFVDAGDVEQTARIDTDNIRVAPGFGFRITVPALGPAPIALDFAFPIARADDDQTQMFSFFVGFGR